MHSIIKNIKKIDVHLEPFPYVVVDNALDQDLYDALENEYPFEYRIDGYSGYANNTRYQVSAVDGLRGTRLSPLWQEFVSYHTSSDFYKDISEVFSAGIQKYYPQLKSNMKVGVRFKDTDADLWMDCQPGMNSPVTEVSSVKGAHLDHASELFGGLLYFRHSEDTSTGGDLEVYKASGPVTYYGARFVDEHAVQKVASVPYARNRLVLFLNTIDSIHGVSLRSKTPYTRRLVNFIGEVDQGPLFEIPYQKSILARAARMARLLIG